MTDVFLGGTEQKMWRTLLKDQGVDHVSLSYVGLRRRIKDPSKWDMAGQYAGQVVYLDSGAATLNRDEATDPEDAAELAQLYMDFVDQNLSVIEFASEFDALALGPELLARNRRDFWELLPDEKWMPVWHADTGTRELERLAGTYARVGVLRADSEKQDITPLLRRLAGRTMLHGVSMTRMASMQEIPWSSVGTTSWLNVTQYGETFVWTGREMRWYPKSEKDKARKRHRTWLIDNGFDADLIEADDNGELLKLSIWSWRKFSESLQPRREVTPSVLDPFGQIQEPPPPVVDTPGVQAGNAELVPQRGKKLLPVLGVTTHDSTDADGNVTSERRMTTPGSGLLRCDTCFLREKCPEMQPGADCAYEIPAEVRTTAQLAAVQDWAIEVQTQRVAFMRLVELHEGGYADGNTSAEIDRLGRMIKAKQEIGKAGFSINIAQVAAPPAGGGMIGQIFGREVADRMGELPAPVAPSDVVDADVVTES